MNINFLLLDDKFLAQKFANEINANYSTSLPLPIHPSGQPASQVATGRWPVGSLLPWLWPLSLGGEEKGYIAPLM